MRREGKRFWLVGLVLLAAVLTAGGCGKKATPENLLTDMGKNMKEIKSVSGNMNLKGEFGAAGETVSVSMDADMEVTKKPEASHMKGNIKIDAGGSNMKTNMESYQVKEKDSYVTYAYAQDQWVKQTIGSDEVKEMENLLDDGMYEELKEAYKSFKLKEEPVEVNEKKCFELTGKIDGELISSFLSGDMAKSLAVDIALDSIKDSKIPCVIDIYEDSILPAKMHIDLKDMLEKVMEDSFGEMNIDDYYVEIVYEEYDKVDKIKIPKEAKEAEEADEYSGGDGFDEDKDDGADKPETKAAKQSGKLGDNWDSYTVQVGEKVLTLPCNISDLEAAGLTLDTEDMPEDTKVDADDFELAFFQDEAGNMIMVDLINTSDSEKKVKDCLVGGINVADYDLEAGGLTVVFPGGITIGSAKEDVLAKYGEADDAYEEDTLHMYTWSDDSGNFRQCEMDIDPETNKVKEMSITKYD